VDVKQVNEYNFSEQSQVLLIAIERNSTQKTLQKIGENTSKNRVHVGLYGSKDSRGSL